MKSLNNLENVKINLAKRKNFKEIAKIYQEGFSEAPYNEKWTFEEAFKKIKIFSKYCDIWEIKGEKKVIGFLIVNPNHWKIGEIVFVEELGVKKEFRKKNIATYLIKSFMKHYKQKGYKKIMAIINKKAKSFGLIKKFNLKIQKQDLLIEVDLK